MSQVRHRYTHICIMEREGSMARMARTQPSGVDFMLARVEFQGKQMHTATGGAVRISQTVVKFPEICDAESRPVGAQHDRSS